MSRKKQKPTSLYSVEAWLRDQIVPAAIALKADPSKALTPDQVRASLTKARRRHAAARRASPP